MSDFWSRRKAAVEAEIRAEDLVQLEAVQAAEEAELAERSDEELLAEAGQPEPETLESAEDVREFLKAALPERLKTRALRRLWRLNPIFANLDGLVDYGEDFTDAATVVENMQTVYQVGKGMFIKMEELTAEVEGASAEDEDEEFPEIETDANMGEEAEYAESSEIEHVAIVDLAPEPESDPGPLPAPSRRMRFQFET